MSDQKLGAAVIVQGQVVAWFAEWNETVEEFVREQWFGKWLTWRAIPPELVPLTAEEEEKCMAEAKELSARIVWTEELGHE